MYGKDQIQNETSNYVEISSQTMSLVSDAYSAASERAFNFMKSVFEISTRPYAASNIETATRENTDRFSQIANLTLGELEDAGKRNTELAQKLVEQSTKLQETYVKTLRGMIETGVSNMNYVKETAAKQVDTMTSRVTEMQNRATSAVSSN